MIVYGHRRARVARDLGREVRAVVRTIEDIAHIVDFLATALYTDDDALAEGLLEAGRAVGDPLWRMPLHKGYERMLKAQIADLTNAPSGGMAGAITAALFLKRFVSPGRRWAHFDIFGWSPTERAHSPVGGEAQAIRAIYRYLQSGAD